MPDWSTHRGSRLVGILGGMGPSATVDFYDKLVRHTPASRDQDHLRVTIWADPTVPSRQDALLTGGPDPTPWLTEGIHHLLASNVDLVVAPCNTVHAYLVPLMEVQPVEFISIIDATIAAVCSRRVGRVGLLATDGALVSGLYQKALDAASIEWSLPQPSEQQQLMSLIAAVKAGHPRLPLHEKLTEILQTLHTRGISTAIAGCTEISALLQEHELQGGVEVIDPALELALATVRRAVNAGSVRKTGSGSFSTSLTNEANSTAGRDGTRSG